MDISQVSDLFQRMDDFYSVNTELLSSSQSVLGSVLLLCGLFLAGVVAMLIFKGLK